MEYKSTDGNTLREILEEIQKDKSHPACESNTIMHLLTQNKTVSDEPSGAENVAENSNNANPAGIYPTLNSAGVLEAKITNLEKTVEKLVNLLSQKDEN